MNEYPPHNYHKQNNLTSAFIFKQIQFYLDFEVKYDQDMLNRIREIHSYFLPDCLFSQCQSGIKEDAWGKLGHSLHYSLL